MAVITYEDVIPSPIANATVQKGFADGVHRIYSISAVDGYVLHDNGNDWTEIDPITGEETLKLGYSRGTCSCAASYDFVANPREFYAVPEDSVPADQIFGSVNNDHEIA